MLSVVWIIFVGIMISAAVIDLIWYRIPNAFVVALAVLFAIVAVLHWNDVEWLGHIAAFVLVFGAGIFLYAIRQMGAGDVKLLGVVALWSGVYALPSLLLFVSVCGLAGMLVILVLRMIVPRLQSNKVPAPHAFPRVLTRGQGIPYAIGIGPGAIIASWDFAPWLWSF